MTVRAPLLAFAAALALAPAASAATTAIATTTVDGPISALDGWVAWSAPDPAAPGYDQLVVAHDGTTRVLPVPSRRKAFDVDLGTDRTGRVVATFSRCRAYDPHRTFPPAADYRCAAKVVDLQSGTERAVGEPKPRDASDTHPSMWRGRVAFGRLDSARHKQVEQLELYDPATHRLRTLKHGTVPTKCPYKTCTSASVSGRVTSVDLGPKAVAYGWTVIAPGVAGYAGFETRVDRLLDGRSALLGSGFAGEACAGGPDAVSPQTPAVSGTAATFIVETDTCYVGTFRLRRASVTDRIGSEAKLTPDGDLLETAPAAGGLYALVAPKPTGEDAPTCTAPGAPCVVARLDAPALTPSRHRPPAPPLFG